MTAREIAVNQKASEIGHLALAAMAAETPEGRKQLAAIAGRAWEIMGIVNPLDES